MEAYFTVGEMSVITLGLSGCITQIQVGHRAPSCVTQCVLSVIYLFLRSPGQAPYGANRRAPKRPPTPSHGLQARPRDRVQCRLHKKQKNAHLVTLAVPPSDHRRIMMIMDHHEPPTRSHHHDS